MNQYDELKRRLLGECFRLNDWSISATYIKRAIAEVDAMKPEYIPLSDRVKHLPTCVCEKCKPAPAVDEVCECGHLRTEHSDDEGGCCVTTRGLFCNCEGFKPRQPAVACIDCAKYYSGCVPATDMPHGICKHFELSPLNRAEHQKLLQGKMGLPLSGYLQCDACGDDSCGGMNRRLDIKLENDKCSGFTPRQPPAKDEPSMQEVERNANAIADIHKRLAKLEQAAGGELFEIIAAIIYDLGNMNGMRSNLKSCELLDAYEAKGVRA